MKGDFTRDTFDRQKHYHDVRMQQGRVQLDADWNEQLDIAAHRVETETKDVVGLCGVPLHAGGFHIVATAGDLSADEQEQEGNQDLPPLQSNGDFYISAGRYYVDGILCENDHIVAYSGQQDRPGTVPVGQSGTYLIYMDVWLRHITALDDPDIREVALGGPDTATRTQSLWQVHALRVGDTGMDTHCLSDLAAWNQAIAPGDGRMAAQAEEDDQSSNPCELAAQGGYRRLENQLYRVEVHTPGPRGTATFKWSRDNGAIVAGWESQTLDDLTISQIGRDAVRGFASGQWIELIDDTLELSGLPGTLVKLQKVEGNVLTIDPATATGPVDRAQFPLNPKIRRWDSDGEITPTNLDWIDLEDGVQVQFTAGSYRTGDLWLIPARTATSIDSPAVVWPLDESTGKPERQRPHGVRHHYCRLAVAEFDSNQWTVIHDCRKIFAPLTEMGAMFYVGGDGQAVMPGGELAAPLQVGVACGEHPVPGALVRFRRISAEGALLPGGGTEIAGTPVERDVLTDAFGIAEVRWQLGGPDSDPVQFVHARWLDVDESDRHLPIQFSARLSMADQVYYDPTGGCGLIPAETTVETALDRLKDVTRIFKLSGDGQQTHPGGDLPQSLEIMVSNDCGPVANADITIQPEGQGRVALTFAGLDTAIPGNPINIQTDANGRRAFFWRPDPNPQDLFQQVAAQLVGAGGLPIGNPDVVRFHAFMGVHRCWRYLDELRSNGVVRDANGQLGIELVPAVAGQRIQFGPGIAYVKGCRLEIAAGDVGGLVDGRNLIAVDADGEVVRNNQATNDDFALIGAVYLLEGDLRRIVDLRLDLTHLDDKVRSNRQAIAARRPDRRQFIPLLVRTLGDLVYRDGTQQLIATQRGRDLTLDGRHIWMTSMESNNLIAIDHKAGSDPQIEMTPIPFDQNARLIEYDGKGKLILTPSMADDATDLDLYVMDVNRREVQRIVFLPGIDSGLLQPADCLGVDPYFVWLSLPYSGDLNLSVMVVLDLGTFTLEAIQAFPRIRRFCFDGKHMWVVSQYNLASGAISFFQKYWVSSGGFQIINAIPQSGRVVDMAFDGAFLWATFSGERVPVRINVNTDEVFPLGEHAMDDARMVCDGSFMWLIEGNGAMHKYDCASASAVGRHNLPGDVRFRNGLFDGTHLWFNWDEGNGDGPFKVAKLLAG
ncbi:MAG: DUF6519 domain-containing protein [Desulfobacterales bacterium]|jgi:hypothetical protein